MSSWSNNHVPVPSHPRPRRNPREEHAALSKGLAELQALPLAQQPPLLIGTLQARIDELAAVLREVDHG